MTETIKKIPQIEYDEALATLHYLKREAVTLFDEKYSYWNYEKRKRDIKAVSSADFACFDDYLAQIGAYIQLDKILEDFYSGLRTCAQAIKLTPDLRNKVNPKIVDSLSDLIETSVAQINEILEHVPQTPGIDYIVPLEITNAAIARCCNPTDYKDLMTGISDLLPDKTPPFTRSKPFYCVLDFIYGTNANRFSEMSALRSIPPDQKFFYPRGRPGSKSQFEIQCLAKSEKPWYQKAIYAVVDAIWGHVK